MIGTRHQLLELIKQTLERATPEEKRLLREELVQVLRQPPTSEDLEFLRAVGITWNDEPNETARRAAYIHGLAEAVKQIQIEESQLSLFRLRRRTDGE
jgi:hypothetical protein